MRGFRKLRIAVTKARAVGLSHAARMGWDRLRGRRYPLQMDEAQAAFQVLTEARSSGTMIDVGAHFGGSLAPFLDTGWRVLAFEPDRRNRAALLAAFGDRPNLTIDPRAVSESSESGVVLFRSPMSTGISGLSRFHSTHRAVDRVDTVTLAEALAMHGIRDVDFLKIDTEGFDLMVLRGLDWQCGGPTVVMCEFEDQKTVPLGYDFHGMAAFLQDRGYQVIVSEWHPVRAYGERHEWRGLKAYPCELASPLAWGNLLAARDQALARGLERRLVAIAEGVTSTVPR
jgi:FkbM family methyltransferase